LSVGVVVLSLFFKRVLPRLPIAFFAVIASIWASDVFDFAGHGIAIMGPTAGGLPSLQLPLPTWHEALTLLPVAVSCFAVILAQSSATGRVFADRYDEQLDEDADILGLAAANAAAAVTGAFVVNGSPTQTAMADLAGARSQYAQLTFAAVVAIVLLFLSGWLEYLPRAVLASVVFTIAIGLLDLKSLREIRRESPGEFALAVFTAGAVVVVGVENGIVLAVAISLMRHVRHSYHPHTVILAPGPDGQWQPRTATPGMQTAPGLIVYRFGADLFFANDHFFVDEVRRLIDAAPTRVHRFIVDAGAITDLDFSASRTLKNLCDALTGQGIDFVFARVSAYLRADMDRHGISPAIGEGRIFSTLHEALGEPAHPPPG
jgi:MFS superfamily sulfate permease-like transporter